MIEEYKIKFQHKFSLENSSWLEWANCEDELENFLTNFSPKK